METRIKSYGKSELALMYSPHICASGARKKLNVWIERSPGLKRSLEENGGLEGCCYTPAQVKLIFEALGEP